MTAALILAALALLVAFVAGSLFGSSHADSLTEKHQRSSQRTAEGLGGIHAHSTTPMEARNNV